MTDKTDTPQVELERENASLRKDLAIAKLKNQGTLANNLCPDHRDKQQGKPCLACEIERLERVKRDTWNKAVEASRAVAERFITHYYAEHVDPELDPVDETAAYRACEGIEFEIGKLKRGNDDRG